MLTLHISQLIFCMFIGFFINAICLVLNHSCVFHMHIDHVELLIVRVKPFILHAHCLQFVLRYLIFIYWNIDLVFKTKISQRYWTVHILVVTLEASRHKKQKKSNSGSVQHSFPVLLPGLRPPAILYFTLSINTFAGDGSFGSAGGSPLNLVKRSPHVLTCRNPGHGLLPGGRRQQEG